jgi:Ca2+-binding RTX toxin-like protein
MITIKDGAYMDNTYGRIETLRFANGQDADINLMEAIKAIPVMGTADNDAFYGSDERNDVVHGLAGNDDLYGYNGNDVFDGGTGDDMLNGGNGHDAYVFGFGYGNDTINDNIGTDVIQFAADVRASDITITRTMFDVFLTLSDGSMITITDGAYMGSTTGRVETLCFANGTDADINLMEAIKAIPVMGTTGNDAFYGSDTGDVVYGLSGNDYLYGGSGNDVLDGGTGNDVLSGAAGDDTYVFGPNYGTDTIMETAGNDIIDVMDMDYDQLWLEKVGNDLKIAAIGSDDSMTVKNWYSSDSYKVETIQTSDMYLDKSNVDLLVQAMASFNPPTQGTINNSTLSNTLKDTINNIWMTRS